jgi:hypothetical protein
MTVPYTFANQTGPLPLQELDQNFAAVNQGVDTAVTVTGNAQPNITSVGVLNSLSLNATVIAIGANTNANSSVYTISIGGNAGAIAQRYNAIAIGGFTGNNAQGANSVSVGFFAGFNSQGPDCVAIGTFAGRSNQNFGAVAIGQNAGNTSQFSNAVAVGRASGFLNQSTGAVAVGYQAGSNTQGSFSVAIGSQTSLTNQGSNSVAIGSYAGNPVMAQNSICINGLSSNLAAPTANALYIAPIRNSNANVIPNALYYNTSTYEITYGPAGAGTLYDNSNVATFLANFGSNTISTTGNITTDGFFVGTFVGNVTGNLVVPGSPTEILYNANGNAGASAAFTFDAASNILSIGGNAIASQFIGNGSGLSSITGANVTGTVSTANTITTNAQPNITSVGILTSLAVNGNATATNLISTGQVIALGNISGSRFIGNGFGLSTIVAANIVGTVSTADTVVTNAQPNITSVGTLTSLTVTGNTTSGNLLTGGQVSATGNVTGNNITGLTSITLPVYAANVDRDTAIPTPTAGIMALVANVFQGYNGSNWVTFTAS